MSETFNPDPSVIDRPEPKRKKRVFLWVFLAVQVLFAIWMISALGSGSGQPTDCGSLDAETCNTASDVGTGIAVVLIIGVWFFVDCFMAVAYAVVKMSRRP